jgi:hypothetical protein
MMTTSCIIDLCQYTAQIAHLSLDYTSQRHCEKVRDGEGVKKNKLFGDLQFSASEYQRVLVEASREQPTLALDIGLEYDKNDASTATREP